MNKLLATLLVTLSMSANADFKDGNKLYSEINGESNQWFNAIGYVAGVHDAVSGILICAPNNATQGQMLDMVKNYLSMYPEQRDRLASTIVIDLLMARWPCKKKGTSL